ncbi:glycosyltransferase family 2 protein [Pseudoduganella aquatica]|uniref:Glycosyltransferase n=1 Tax=Pseudoduganella aquatica TaxID=2660641 RepID=A0A7X4HCA0_9BURK|nr:glycosyltransferase family 2 protein [Pseudoduganella aquatica]MYN08616.1 glycosyltransferase [Pseudoduganella aquatica]
MAIQPANLHWSGRRSLSVVLPVLNEAPSLAVLLPNLAATLARCGVDWEVVVVDDGGSDNLAEVLQQFEQHQGHCNVQLLRLSRNFGKEAALTAGLAATRGDAVLCMDGDGQHPVELIPTLIERWRSGYDMVAAAQTTRAHESALLGWCKRRFYGFMYARERYVIPANAGDFRLMDRRVVQALMRLPERTRFMKGLYAWLGFKTSIVPFRAGERTAGESKFRLRQLLGLAALGVTAFSVKPLRMVSVAGALISVAALCYGLYIMAETLIIGNRVSGWATLASGMMLLSGIQLLCLGVIAEYLGRVFEETKQRPLYVLEERVDHSALGQGAPVRQVAP